MEMKEMDENTPSTPDDWLGVGGFVELDGRWFLATDRGWYIKTEEGYRKPSDEEIKPYEKKLNVLDLWENEGMR